ncbi:MAG: PASTA domain-containing protein, partial [Oscillospiraceae bacterium]|nr:PASTA domain-containing protein [Oscillospiraceae bacterium]
ERRREDDDEEDKRFSVKRSNDPYRSRQRSRKLTMLIGILCVLVFLIALFVFMWNFMLKDMFDPSEERVEVPDFHNMLYDEVKNNEEYTKYFNLNPDYVYSDEYEEGRIIDQDITPERQMTVQANKIDILLTVSMGKEVKYMPNFINKDYREAVTVLEGYELGLNIKLEVQPNKEVTAGYVIQQYPDADTALVQGGTIYLTYSGGPDENIVEVPALVGFSESRAIEKLQDANLSYESKYVYSSEYDEGEVIAQSHDAGSEVPIHTEITIHVSLGAEPYEAPPVNNNTDNSNTNTDNNNDNSSTNNNGDNHNQDPDNHDNEEDGDDPLYDPSSDPYIDYQGRVSGDTENSEGGGTAEQNNE